MREMSRSVVFEMNKKKGKSKDNYNDGRRPEKNARRGDRRDAAVRGAAVRDTSAERSIAENVIAGRNAVAAAIDSGREIEKIVIADGTGGSVKKLIAEAKEKKLKVEYRDRSWLDKYYEGAHQGVIAFAAAHKYSSVDEIMAGAEASGEKPFIIILDDLEDPHNLGAVMRTAECAGAHGIIIGKNGAVGLTQTVAKASAGAIEYMKVARVTNIARTVDDLKERGVWVAACDMDGDNYTDADLKGAIAIVIGNEGKGISRLVREKCDFVVSIPMLGRISSLNASNAAAILMYEIRRQRDMTR